QPCSAGQSPGKDGSCTPLTSAKAAASPSCPSGQTWDGNQCAMAGAPATVDGSSIQTNCTGPTANAQNVIMRLRAARVRKNAACGQNSAGTDCQEAEAQYNSTFSEYQA